MGKVSVFKLCSFLCLKSKGKNKNAVLLIRKNITYKSSIPLVFTVMIILLVFPKHVFAKEKTLETIRLQLRWDNQFQFAGYYAADWNGYYKDEGLSVELVSALKSDGKVLSSTNEVSEGRADFGIGAADVLIANDKGADLRVAAVIMQQSAARLYLKKETSYSFITDLTKLKVARKVNDLIDVELQAMLMNEGINPSKISAYPLQLGVENLFSEGVQVLPGYKLSFPFIAGKLGVDIKEINPLEYGVDFYGDSLFVSGKLADKKPDVVARFVRASLKGWEYALNHPEEVANKISENLETVNKINNFKEYNLYQAQAIKELTIYPLVEIGHINPYRWEKMHKFLKEISIVKKDLNIEQFIFNPKKIQEERDKNFKKIFMLIMMIVILLYIIILTWVNSLKRLVNIKTKKIHENEIRFRSVFENTNDTICVSNLQTIVLVNPSFEKMFGYKQEEAYGRSVLELTTPGFRDIFSENIKKRSNDEEAQSLYDVMGLRRDGSVFNLEVKISTYKQESELYTIAIMRDITEQKEAVEELKIAKDTAEKLSISKSEFIANMSHELRTPLNVNIAAIQLFQSYVKSDLNLDKEKVSKHLKPMTQNCLRLLRLVNNLIDTTKVDAGFYEPHFKNYDIINLIEGIVMSVADYVKQKNIELIFDTEVEELILSCDIDMVERIMLNILSNAIKFTNDCVIVNIYIRDNTVVIVVKDNGQGIETFNQKTIFLRYKQVAELFTRENEGSGIGLALTKSLIEMHGGNIHVKSEYGRGAEFIMGFPIKKYTSSEFIQRDIKDSSYSDKFIEKMNVEFSDIYK